MSHMVCHIWKFSRSVRRATFLPRNTKWCMNCKRLYSSIKNAHFKDFWILISQYNSLRQYSGKGMQKIEPKSKHGIKEL